MRAKSAPRLITPAARISTPHEARVHTERPQTADVPTFASEEARRHWVAQANNPNTITRENRAKFEAFTQQALPSQLQAGGDRYMPGFITTASKSAVSKVATQAAHVLGAATKQVQMAPKADNLHFHIQYHDYPSVHRWNAMDHNATYYNHLLAKHHDPRAWASVCRALGRCATPATTALLQQTSPLTAPQLSQLMKAYSSLTLKHRETLLELLFLYAYHFHDAAVIRLLKHYGLASHVYPWAFAHDLVGGKVFQHAWLAEAKRTMHRHLPYL